MRFLPILALWLLPLLWITLWFYLGTTAHNKRLKKIKSQYGLRER